MSREAGSSSALAARSRSAAPGRAACGAIALTTQTPASHHAITTTGPEPLAHAQVAMYPLQIASAHAVVRPSTSGVADRSSPLPHILGRLIVAPSGRESDKLPCSARPYDRLAPDPDTDDADRAHERYPQNRARTPTEGAGPGRPMGWVADGA